MYVYRLSWTAFFAVLLACTTAVASPLVTGNGFGFAVVSPESGTLRKFYAHPYSFSRPDPKDALSEGVETANFLKSLDWASGSQSKRTAEYVDDSHVIRTKGADGEGIVLMPFGLMHNALIFGWETSSGSRTGGYWQVEWNRPLLSHKALRTSDIKVELLTFEGIEEPLILIPIGKPTAQAATNLLSGNQSWAMISLDKAEELEGVVRDFVKWRNDLSASQLAGREVAELNQWRVKPPAHFASESERHLWRQSETLLRVGQCREPNRPGRYGNGLIVAALPDGSWSTPWVRDMAYAAVAFARMGHQDEARAAILAYFNARPTGKMKAATAGADYQISVVRYFGNGEEEPYFTNEGSTNIEFDDWGLALWVLSEYLQRYSDPTLLNAVTFRGPLYESAREFIVRPLLANTESYKDGLIVAADTSIWEERQKDKKHFAFSTAMAIVGLKGFAEIVGKNGDERTSTDLLAKVALLQKGFDAAFIRDGKLHGTLEEGVKNDIDGALLAIINFRVVTHPAIVRSTLERLELLKVASGGYRRVRGTYTDPAIYEYWYEQEEFLFVDFSLAELYRHTGRVNEAEAILQRIVAKSSADHNFVPEMYVAVPCKLFPGKIGDPTGAIPMVGYGAGVYVMQLLDRDQWSKHNRN